MFMQLFSSTHVALGCFIHKREPARWPRSAPGPSCLLAKSSLGLQGAAGARGSWNLLQHLQTPRKDLAAPSP